MGDSADLIEECNECGFPLPPENLDRAQLLRRMKWAISAQELSFVELRKECVSTGIKGFHSAPESSRPLMLSRMFAQMWDDNPSTRERSNVAPSIAKHFRTLELETFALLEDV